MTNTDQQNSMSDLGVQDDDYNNIGVGQWLYKETDDRQWITLTSSTACLIFERRMMIPATSSSSQKMSRYPDVLTPLRRSR